MGELTPRQFVAILNGLEAAGLIRRRPNSLDLTPVGRSLIAKAKRELQQAHEEQIT